MKTTKSKGSVDVHFRLGSSFSGPLFPAWINAPSARQPMHKLHGVNVVLCHLEGGGFRAIYSDGGQPVSTGLPENTPLVEGWKTNEQPKPESKK